MPHLKIKTVYRVPEINANKTMKRNLRPRYCTLRYFSPI